MNNENTHYVRCIEALKTSPFFAGMDTVSLKELLTHMSLEHWPSATFKNSVDMTQTFRFIISGRLKVYRVNPNTGREHTIFLLSKGDVFDVMYLMDDESHDNCWEAKDDLEILRTDIEQMLRWIFKYPVMQSRMLQYLGHRMRQLEDIATDISLHSTLVRLSGLLLRNINGETHHLEVINNLANEEIASLIGTTRAVVNRHIQELKHCGAITVKRKFIDVRNLQTLMAIAEERYEV